MGSREFAEFFLLEFDAASGQHGLIIAVVQIVCNRQVGYLLLEFQTASPGLESL